VTLRPNAKTIYALKAMVDLARHEGVGPVSLKTVARRQGIPLRYLEQLFVRLRREGLVEAQRGPRGGYRLSRPAGQIPVSRVLRSLQPEKAAPRKGIKPPPGAADPTAALWRELEQAVRSRLEMVTLRQLADQGVRADGPLRHNYPFHI